MHIMERGNESAFGVRLKTHHSFHKGLPGRLAAAVEGFPEDLEMKDPCLEDAMACDLSKCFFASPVEDIR